MTRSFLNICIVFIALSITGCLTSQALLDQRGSKLSGLQIKRILSGASVYGEFDNGDTFYEHYGIDGKYRIQSSGYIRPFMHTTLSGSWRIEEDHVCLDVYRDYDEGCVGVLLNGDALQFVDLSTGDVFAFSTRVEGGGGMPDQSNETAQIIQPTIPSSTKYPTSFPNPKPIKPQFLISPPQPNDIAVIIGNANYANGKDIPNVVPAYADAEGIKNYVTQALGIAEDNIIFLKDATQTDLIGTFGNKDSHKGRLFRYLTPNKSRVFVFYSGHGAPGDQGTNFLVPTDAEASLIDLNGYSLKTLYQNLSKLPAKSVTVVLEACFSGTSDAGTVISNASPVYLKAKDTGIPSNITVIAAGAANQIASWETDKSHGLFTKYFLKGMSGEADNDNDQQVSWVELKDYFEKTVTRSAMRNYGREQTPQIVVGTGG